MTGVRGGILPGRTVFRPELTPGSREAAYVGRRGRWRQAVEDWLADGRPDKLVLEPSPVAEWVNVRSLADLVGQGRYDLTGEKACQADIAAWLALALPPGVVVVREARLGPRDIPDFMVAGSIVLEVKMRSAGARAILRQLARYASYPEVEAIVLATNRPMTLPATIGGKPAVAVSLGEAWL